VVKFLTNHRNVKITENKNTHNQNIYLLPDSTSDLNRLVLAAKK